VRLPLAANRLLDGPKMGLDWSERPSKSSKLLIRKEENVLLCGLGNRGIHITTPSACGNTRPSLVGRFAEPKPRGHAQCRPLLVLCLRSRLLTVNPQRRRVFVMAASLDNPPGPDTVGSLDPHLEQPVIGRGPSWVKVLVSLFREAAEGALFGFVLGLFAGVPVMMMGGTKLLSFVYLPGAMAALGCLWALTEPRRTPSPTAPLEAGTGPIDQGRTRFGSANRHRGTREKSGFSIMCERAAEVARRNRDWPAETTDDESPPVRQETKTHPEGDPLLPPVHEVHRSPVKEVGTHAKTIIPKTPTGRPPSPIPRRRLGPSAKELELLRRLFDGLPGQKLIEAIPGVVSGTYTRTPLGPMDAGREESWRDLGWWDFEIAVLLLFERRGCVVKPTNPTRDGGLDGIVADEKGDHGIQCKRYEKNELVGVDAIRAFIGCLSVEGLRSGFFVTTGRYSPQGMASAEASSRSGITVVLLSAKELTGWGSGWDITMKAVADAKDRWGVPQEPPAGIPQRRRRRGPDRI